MSPLAQSILGVTRIGQETVLSLSLILACVGCDVGEPRQSSDPNGASRLSGNSPTDTPAVAQTRDALPTSKEASRELHAEQTESTADTTVTLVPIGNTTEENEDNPKTDGWDTEVLSNAVTAQWKRLQRLLETKSKLDDADVAPLVASSFSCGALKPKSLRPIFEDRAITVVRSDEPLDDKSSPRYSGGAGFVRTLEELIAPLRESTDLRVKFKVFRVGKRPTTVATRQFVSVTGLSVEGSIEQHATWDCLWTMPETDQLPRLQSIVVREFEQTAVRCQSHTLFADCTQAVLAGNACFQPHLMRGIFDWAGQLERMFGCQLPGYLGLTVADVNGDGLDDVYLCQTGGLPNRLFVQNTNGTATDQSHEASVDWLNRTRSALFVDLDNDGDQDLVIGTRALLFLSNDGDGRFALQRVLREISYAYSLAAADYDNDGDLDVFACQYTPYGNQVQVIPIPLPYHNANNGPANNLLRNEGNWKFTDVTTETGIDAENRRFSFSATWEDYDNDGDMDLYVVNDFGRNCLYRNVGGRFVNIAAEAKVEDMANGMSASWGDYNRDGLMDLYVANMFSAAGNRITYQRQFQPEMNRTTKGVFQRLARGNTLFANRGDGTFDDVSLKEGVTMGRWAWGSIFVDVNNDGCQDLFVANGYITGDKPDDL